MELNGKSLLAGQVQLLWRKSYISFAGWTLLATCGMFLLMMLQLPLPGIPGSEGLGVAPLAWLWFVWLWPVFFRIPYETAKHWPMHQGQRASQMLWYSHWAFSLEPLSGALRWGFVRVWRSWFDASEKTALLARHVVLVGCNWAYARLDISENAPRQASEPAAAWRVWLPLSASGESCLHISGFVLWYGTLLLMGQNWSVATRSSWAFAAPGLALLGYISRHAFFLQAPQQQNGSSREARHGNGYRNGKIDADMKAGENARLSVLDHETATEPALRDTRTEVHYAGLETPDTPARPYWTGLLLPRSVLNQIMQIRFLSFCYSFVLQMPMRRAREMAIRWLHPGLPLSSDVDTRRAQALAKLLGRANLMGCLMFVPFQLFPILALAMSFGVSEMYVVLWHQADGLMPEKNETGKESKA